MNKPNSVQEITHAPLSDEEGPIPSFPPLPLDPATGQLLPMSDEERAARRDAAIRAIKALSRMTDETDDDALWEEVYRNIDAGRPHRKLFEGMY